MTEEVPSPPELDILDLSPDQSDTSTLPTPYSTTPNAPSSLISILTKYDLTQDDIKSIQATLVDLAHTAGKIMFAASSTASSSASISSKLNTSDLVTVTDHKIEDIVSTSLKIKYPNIHFLGEETFKTSQSLTDEPTFICDPIDGTLNFIHGFPNTAVSLALAVEKKPVIGVVYNPFRGDLYTAIKDHGAFLTTSTATMHRLPLRTVPSPLPSLSHCLVAVEWGTDRSPTSGNWNLRTSVAKSLLSSPSPSSPGAMVHSLRSSGSAALDLCYVAAGQLDVFWEGGCWAWDVAAGWCILEEAGGMVASANPGDWNPELEGRVYLAVRGAKRKEQQGIVRQVWELMGERRFEF